MNVGHTDVTQVRINIGCGLTPTRGWLNYDNSPSVLLARHPIVASILGKIGKLSDSQKKAIWALRRTQSFEIQWANATKKIPVPDQSVAALYSSHMVEHLDRQEVQSFLREVARVLVPNGIVRLVVPDLWRYVKQYISQGDADVFMERSGLGREKPRTLFEKLRCLIMGDRGHLWMYDGSSMSRLLSSMGFEEVCVMPAGSTNIADPGELDLFERKEESVYVEARAPGTPLNSPGSGMRTRQQVP